MAQPPGAPLKLRHAAIHQQLAERTDVVALAALAPGANHAHQLDLWDLVATARCAPQQPRAGLRLARIQHFRGRHSVHRRAGVTDAGAGVGLHWRRRRGAPGLGGHLAAVRGPARPAPAGRLGDLVRLVHNSGRLHLPAPHAVDATGGPAGRACASTCSFPCRRAKAETRASQPGRRTTAVAGARVGEIACESVSVCLVGVPASLYQVPAGRAEGLRAESERLTGATRQ